MPTNPYDSYMATPGQPKKEKSPNPYANVLSGPSPLGVNQNAPGRPTTGGVPGPALTQPSSPTPPTAQPPTAQKPPVQPQQQAGGGVTITVGQPQQQQPQQPAAPQAQPAPTQAPPEPAAPKPEPKETDYFVDPKSGQRVVAATPEQQQEHARQMVAARAKFGATPFDNDPNSPKPDIVLGKPNFNVFSGTWS
jgi:hypothetical protein